MRRKTLRTLLAVFAVLPFSSRGAELDVTVTDLRSESGRVKVSLVDSEAAWNETAKPIAARAAAPATGSAQFQFTDLAPGRYAVMVMHDENDNGKLDTNFLGMPIEGYGFSNNPDVMRRATFAEATFDLGADGAAIQVRLR